MSSASQASNDHTLPSSDNNSSRDYGDQDGYDILFPPTDDFTIDTVSSVSSIAPGKIRMRNRVEKILGDGSKEYIIFISDLYYNWIHFGKKYPEKYTDIIKYLDKRITS